MKKITNIAIGAVLITNPLLAVESTVDLFVKETASEAGTHIMAAVKLAEKRAGGSEKNFVTFAKSLRELGFAGIPGSPPHAMHGQGGKKKEVDERVANDRKKEMAQRMKMIGEMNKKYLQSLDMNKDLTIDLAEVEKSISGQLHFQLNDMLKVDKDKDKRLTLSEYALAIPAKGEVDEEGFDWHQRGHFKHDDKNKDGFLDMREMISHSAQIVAERSALVHAVHSLALADTNKDGQVSEAEFTAISDKSSSVWAKVSPNGAPLSLKESYTQIYWQPLDVLKVIIN